MNSAQMLLLQNKSWVQEKLSLDPEYFERVRERRSTRTAACSMCGDFCVYRVLENLGL